MGLDNEHLSFEPFRDGGGDVSRKGGCLNVTKYDNQYKSQLVGVSLLDKFYLKICSKTFAISA